MNTSRKRTLILASLILALGLGLILGVRVRSQKHSETSPNLPGVLPPTSLNSIRPKSHPEFTASHKTSANPTGSAEERQHQAMTTLSQILNTSKQVERTRQMLVFLDQLGDDQIATVISGFHEAGWVDFNRNEYSLLISTWIERDPFAAITFLDQNVTDGWTRKLAASAWAAEHPEAATHTINGLQDHGKVNDWIVGLIAGIARNDPEGALHTLSTLTTGHTKKQAVRSILPEVVLRGSEFAGQWLEKIKEPKLQQDSAKQLAHSLAQRDPAAASQWISEMTSARTRREASQIVSEIYAEQDLDAAIAWTETLPPDSLAEAAKGVTKHLTRQDPASAAQWLLKLGDTPDLDPARLRFLHEATPHSPQIALQHVPTLSRSQDQEQQYQKVLNHWKTQDPTAAIAWASQNASELPSTVLKSILPKKKRNSKHQ